MQQTLLPWKANEIKHPQCIMTFIDKKSSYMCARSNVMPAWVTTVGM